MKGKTPCPDPFPITPEMREWAHKNVGRLDIDWYTEQMVDYWLGHGKMMKDWTRTWRNWMRNSLSINRQPRMTAPQKTVIAQDNVHDISIRRSARAHGIDPTGLTESQINNAIWQKQQEGRG